MPETQLWLTEEYDEVLAGTGTHAKSPYHANADLSIISSTDGSWKAYDALGQDVTADLTSAVTAT